MVGDFFYERRMIKTPAMFAAAYLAEGSADARNSAQDAAIAAVESAAVSDARVTAVENKTRHLSLAGEGTSDERHSHGRRLEATDRITVDSSADLADATLEAIAHTTNLAGLTLKRGNATTKLVHGSPAASSSLVVNATGNATDDKTVLTAVHGNGVVTLGCDSSVQVRTGVLEVKPTTPAGDTRIKLLLNTGEGVILSSNNGVGHAELTVKNSTSEISAMTFDRSNGLVTIPVSLSCANGTFTNLTTSGDVTCLTKLKTDLIEPYTANGLVEFSSGVKTNSITPLNANAVAVNGSATVSGNLTVAGSTTLGDTAADSTTVVGDVAISGDITVTALASSGNTTSEFRCIPNSTAAGSLALTEVNVSGTTRKGAGIRYTPADGRGSLVAWDSAANFPSPSYTVLDWDRDGTEANFFRSPSTGTVKVGANATLAVNTVETNYTSGAVNLFTDNTATTVTLGHTSRPVVVNSSGTTVNGNSSLNGNLTVTGNTTLGDGSSDTTTITGQTSITGNVRVCPPTSGTQALLTLSPCDWVPGRTARINVYGGADKSITWNFNNNPGCRWADNHSQDIYTGLGVSMSFDNNNNVSIPNGNLTVSGTVTCVSLTETSDAAAKQDVEDVADASRILQIRPVTYRVAGDDGGPLHAGVIAQELMSVVPEAVRSIPASEEDEPATLGVEYQHLLALLIKSHQELAARVAVLEAAAA